MTLETLREFTVARSLFNPVSLQGAIDRLGFVQADPIRAPARAQDLILRHRVAAYRAGDLERQYGQLEVDEDVFINYGFVTRELSGLMHPREKPPNLSNARTRRQKLLTFVRDKGDVHPAEADAHFSHGTVTNYWGGSSNATTHLLEDMHYRGWLRVTGRERGVRRYALREHVPAAHAVSPRERLDRLIDVVVNKYAPLPAQSLSVVVSRLRYAVPQWRGLIRPALERARKRLARDRMDGVEWYWPADERPHSDTPNDTVRFLAPFDPIVWDRRRFEFLWHWPYRFEAYTPVKKRRLGYYALPLLWRSQVVGWVNLSVTDRTLHPTFGYVASFVPRDRGYRRQLEAEVDRVRKFLDL